jgi:hypothetical protein
MAIVWGVVFALYLWWGSHQVGLEQRRAILLGIIAGIACAVWIYARGANLDRGSADRPGAFLGRFSARRRKPGNDEAS